MEEVAESLAAALGGVEGLEHLDDGGQGLVWRFQEGGEDLVVKVMKAENDPRIEKEIAALGSIDSPFVMKFSGSFEFEHRGKVLHAIKGEFVPGGTVQDKLVADGPPSSTEAFHFVHGALLGIKAIHDHGRIHRDLKPQNIALRDGDWATPVVLDLGLVRNLDETSITIYPQLLGTLPFMAPEQLRQERAVKRTDVFGIGAVLFYAMTGTHPFFDPVTDAEMSTDDLRLKMIERGDELGWPRWSNLPVALDEDVAAFVGSLIAADAFERPSVEAALAECESLLRARGEA